MALLEQNPKTARSQHNNGPNDFSIAVAAGLQGDEARHSAMPSPLDSLRTGSKGETRFLYLSELSLEDVTPNTALSSPELHTSQEDQPNLPQDIQFPAMSSTFGGSTRSEEFKTVDEIWDKGSSGYKTVESPGSAEYPFVVRRRFGKPNTDYKIYIDITSEGLRAIVRQALEDAKDASSCNMFKEESITVDLDDLLNCLPQLEKLRNAFHPVFTLPGDRSVKHLNKLVGFLLQLREIDTPPMTHSREVDI